MEQRKTIRLEPMQSPKSPLPRLMRDDSSLPPGTTLVLLFDQVQAEMTPSNRQGVRSWMESQIQLHGLPSLLRFGRRDRPSVFRRDEFAPWLHATDEASVASL